MSQVADVNAQDFETQVLQDSGTVVVDFWAEWCPPCRALSPVVDKVAEQLEGQAKFVKCDVDANTELSEQYGVMQIPNLVFFKNGQVVDQSVGYLSEAQLKQKVEALTNS
jgi:thioredoxin 1